ncbi:C25 family cysteine peptidase [Fibrobacter sp.]|uniref:C25 family cysteine peptidase n=1 Tax=Fibrobacter sp. TaxID=35828 RepID=UPI003890AE88
MKNVLKFALVLLAICELCFAAETRRAEIYIDEDLYKDSEILAAVKKYAGAVEKNFDFTIDIKSYPSALVLDKASLDEGSPSFKVGSTAEELKADIKKSWQDKSKAPLAGVILIGNLPYAQMEYFVRESDGKAGYPEDSDFLNYQRWVADLFFMDLDGTWEDEITGVNCSFGGSCARLEWEPNGIYDAHYNKDGELGSDDFEIWVSRVNPYGEAREKSIYDFYDQLEDYEGDYLPKVKELLMRWLNKAYNQQVNSASHSDRALFSYSNKSELRFNDFPVTNFIQTLSNLYNETDIIQEGSSEKYKQYIRADYDWVSHLGHGNEQGFESGVSILDFNSPVEVKARVFDLNSCSIARYLDIDGYFYNRTIGLAHLFRTLKGGVAVIGHTKTGGGYQDNEYFYNLLGDEMLGDAYLKWANHRTLVFETSKYPKDVYEWFYEHALFGDPFLTFDIDKKNVKSDSVPENIALHAVVDFNISGKCYDDTKGANGRCTVVCGSTERSYCAGVHGDAEIGSIYARGGVVLNGVRADTVTIYNTFEEAEPYINATISYGHMAYSNPKKWNKDFLLHETLPEFPTENCDEVISVKGEYTLVDGKCLRELTLEKGAKLIIPEGEFYIQSFYMNSTATYAFANPGHYSVLHMENGFDWYANPSTSLTPSERKLWASGFKVYVYGIDHRVDLYGDFNGTVYAPASIINVRGNSYGSFHGYSLAVHDVGTVWYAPFDPVGGIPADTAEVADTSHSDTSSVRDTLDARDSIPECSKDPEEPQAIVAGDADFEQMNTPAFSVAQQGRVIVVAAHRPVKSTLFDLQGRVLQRSVSASKITTFTAPRQGTYFVQADDFTKKIFVK